jgi:hypothetical protein
VQIYFANLTKLPGLSRRGWFPNLSFWSFTRLRMCNFGIGPACSLCCQETSVLKRVLVSTARQTRELYGCAFAYRYELTQFASGPRSGSALDFKNPAVWGRPSGTRAMAAHPASRFLGTIKLVFPRAIACCGCSLAGRDLSHHRRGNRDVPDRPWLTFPPQ